MQSGTVKFFKSDSGYGFIQHEQNGKDVFFHKSGLAKGTNVAKGDKVSFEITPGKQGNEATNILKCND